MSNRLVWIGILVVLALTIVTVANCRRLPEPWYPQAGTAATGESQNLAGAIRNEQQFESALQP